MFLINLLFVNLTQSMVQKLTASAKLNPWLNPLWYALGNVMTNSPAHWLVRKIWRERERAEESKPYKLEPIWKTKRQCLHTQFVKKKARCQHIFNKAFLKTFQSMLLHFQSYSNQMTIQTEVKLSTTDLQATNVPYHGISNVLLDCRAVISNIFYVQVH